MTTTPRSAPCFDCMDSNYLYDIFPYCPACLIRREEEANRQRVVLQKREADSRILTGLIA